MVAMKPQTVLTDAEKAVIEHSFLEEEDEDVMSGLNKEVRSLSLYILLLVHS